MRFNILAIENKRPKWAKDLFDLYVKRFDKSIQISWTGFDPNKIKRSSKNRSNIHLQGAKLLNSLPNDTIIISLDKEGALWTTQNLKKKFDNWINSTHKDVTFLIGGPEGLSKECLNKSNEIWSLSSLTFAHSFVPVIIIEQLYRVWSMGRNHPYHR
ncbi:MAG: 23S rRNA (pseudouridine(1915)-N(3))-methyltransferase RlmH [Gammaproteobacteria bacterium]